MIKINKIGYPYVTCVGILALLAWFFHFGIANLLIALFLFFLHFFQDYERIKPDGELFILSPCDGIIKNIEQYENGYKISINIGILNTRILRLPFAGVIKKIKPRKEKGKLDLVVEGNITYKISHKPYLHENFIALFSAKENTGSKYGFLYFGNLIELYIPDSCIIVIKNKQSVIAGETIIASIDNK